MCLERAVELDNVRLRVRDWPGLSGPVVHVANPSTTLIDRLASTLAPRYRVMSVSPREDNPYQVEVVDVVGVLDQFGFTTPVLIGERLGCLTALLVAAWYPDHVGRLVMIQPTFERPAVGVSGWALRDCPPDLARLRGAVQCPVLETPPTDLDAIDAIVDFLVS